MGQEDLPTLELEKLTRTDVVFPPEIRPPPEKMVKLDANWSVKPKGINRGLQCDITNDCALFLDQIDALKRYSRIQAIRLVGTTNIFQNQVTNTMVQEAMAQNSQEHPQTVSPETVTEMHGENPQGLKEEPEPLPPSTTIEEPLEDVPATQVTHQSNDEDCASDDSSTHNISDKDDEQDLLAQDMTKPETQTQ